MVLACDVTTFTLSDLTAGLGIMKARTLSVLLLPIRTPTLLPLASSNSVSTEMLFEAFAPKVNVPLL